jgi:hypothetical protein
MSQITIDPSIALKLPLDITNSDEITGANEDRLVIGDASGSLTSLPLSTDGQVLIGDTAGGTPSWATLTAGTNIDITNGSGSITINATGTGIGPEFSDLSFRVYDSDDDTRKVELNCSQITSGITRTITIADRDIDTDTLSDTFITDSGNAQPDQGNLTIVGSGGVTTAGTGSQVTISSSAIKWNYINTSVTAEANNGYIIGLGASSRVYISLPDTMEKGDVIEVAGYGPFGWRISQTAALQKIHFGSDSSSAGTSGYLYSNNRYASVSIICTLDGAEFVVKSGNGDMEVF